MGNEVCDDGNTQDGDGCSSTCQVEDHFSCSASAPSVCSLNSLQVQFSYTTKQRGSNTLVSRWTLTPSGLTLYARQNWLSVVTLHEHQTAAPSHALSVSVASASYDSGEGLVLHINYDSQLPPSFSLSINYPLLGTAFQNVNVSYYSASSTAQNNLSTRVYTGSDYAMAEIIEYLTMVMGLVTLVLFVVGYFGAKLVVLEAAKAVQLTALSLVTLSDLSPTF